MQEKNAHILKKTEVQTYIFVVAMTLIFPSMLYLGVNDHFEREAAVMANFADKADLLASNIEQGKKMIYIENIPETFRRSAKADRALAEVYHDYEETIEYLTFAMFTAAFVQALLLGMLVKRCRVEKGDE